MMTILNEEYNRKKYTWLHFVEFLEMLCRIVIICVTKENTIEHQAHFLLELIYNDFYEKGYLSEEEHKLIPVDEELR